MIPAVRAVADRFILDTANIRYVLTYLAKGELKRKAEGGGWTPGQTIGHIALSNEMYADMLEWRMAGDTSLPPWFDPPRKNAAEGPVTAKWSAKQVHERLDASLARLVDVLARLTPEQYEASIGPFPVNRALEEWSGHIVAHGLDLADALPELRFDPMVLNWLLYADFSGQPDCFERQQRLFEEARAYFREQGEDDDEDDEDDD